MKLAIDFGTTNTVVARWEDGMQILSLPVLSADPGGGQSLIPSLVYVRDGQTADVIAGQAVRQQGLDGKPDNRLFRSFKRGIVSQPAPAPRQIDGAQWNDRAAGEIFLRKLIDALPVGQIEQMVLTAPIAAFNSYLSWLDEVMSSLSADSVYIVDEATAAALGYAVTEPGSPVMVFDFGGGTLDLSLVQLPDNRDLTGGFLSRLRRGNTSNNTAKVIAKAGRIMGGSDIDHWLLAWVLERLNLTPADLGNSYASALTNCEHAKIRLSSEPETSVTVEVGGQVKQVIVTRGELEALLAENGFYDALRQIIDKTMRIAHRSGIFKEDVKDVLLVGGVSLMPSVQAALRSYFSDSAVRAEKPFTAIAEGALQITAGYKIDGYVNQSYGLRYIDPKTNTHKFDEIIPIGSRYPMQKPVEIELAAAHDGQAAIELVIGEISADSGTMMEVNYEGGQTVFVADTRDARRVTLLNGDRALRVELSSPARAGERRLRARFVIDDQLDLHVSVTDLKTRRDLLTNAFVTSLGKVENASGDAEPTYTDVEPMLVDAPGKNRLSLRGMSAMFNILPPEAVSLDAAEAALRSDSFGPRHSAAVALNKRGDRDARNVMRRVLTDGSAPSRATAARHLDGFTWYAAEALYRQALADKDSRVREAAIYGLSHLRELNAYQLMTEALENETDNVCEAAAVGLHDCRDAAAVPVLKAALRAKDPAVRVQIMEALSNNDTPDVIPVIRAALSDPDLDVMYAASLSLLEMIQEEALGELSALIARSEGDVRRTLLRGLFHASNYLKINPAAYEPVFDALDAALHDPLPAARLAAIYPLALIRNDRAYALIVNAFERESDSEVKAQIVQLTSNFMLPIADSLLRAALDSPNPQVKAAAQAIEDHRANGGAVEYDEFAAPGIGFAKPSRRESS